MKILIIQFARLGDIFMSWPATRALRRKYPEAEIHFLVRPRFQAATEGLEAVDRVLTFATADLLEPILHADSPEAGMTESLSRTDLALSELRDQNYDLVINWSFSPLSSWVLKSIRGPATQVLGYDRFPDGSLCLTDDLSAYFYAQVGTERLNRVHVTDLFAVMIEADLIDEDWRAPKKLSHSQELPQSYWVLHPGASEGHKRIEPWQWARLLQEYGGFHGEKTLPVVLIGSKEEGTLCHAIEQSVNRVQVINLCGKTSLQETFAVIQRASLLVGGDSAPLHMAALTQTPTMNLSAGKVNFWETGPKAPRSWVYRLDPERPLPSALLGARICRLLEGDSAEDLFVSRKGIPSFEGLFPTESDFAWGLLQAVYFGGDFPFADDLRFIQVVEKLREMNDVVCEQLANPKITTEALGLLVDRADEVFQVLSQMDASGAILIRWLQTERARISPGPVSHLRAAMGDCHRRFSHLLRPYCLSEEVGKESGHG